LDRCFDIFLGFFEGGRRMVDCNPWFPGCNCIKGNEVYKKGILIKNAHLSYKKDSTNEV
jgi:hypothetical protein